MRILGEGKMAVEIYIFLFFQQKITVGDIKIPTKEYSTL